MNHIVLSRRWCKPHSFFIISNHILIAPVEIVYKKILSICLWFSGFFSASSHRGPRNSIEKEKFFLLKESSSPPDVRYESLSPKLKMIEKPTFHSTLPKQFNLNCKCTKSSIFIIFSVSIIISDIIVITTSKMCDHFGITWTNCIAVGSLNGWHTCPVAHQCVKQILNQCLL